MKSSLFCLLLCVSPLCMAQPKNPPPITEAAHRTRYEYRPQLQFPEGSMAWVLVADANLRALPDAKSPSVAKLPIGAEVRLLPSDSTPDEHTHNGVRAPWRKVKILQPKPAAGPDSGWLWAGVLTQTRIKSASDDGTYFYLGLAGREKSGKGRLLAQIRAANAGHELGRMAFEIEAESDLPVALQSHGSQGLVQVNDVLTADYAPQACGVTGGEALLFWSGTQFIHGGFASHFSDPPVFSHEQWILPGDAGGHKGAVLWRKQVQEDEQKDLKQESALWVWGGNGLLKR
ncbi:hypothetical protein V8J88_18670 [Massilia sp. W12]|uniref:hypothetical protein n=1 Tax=Massilia sp. W12 TaxID=3126507 RepID=UPI0030CD8366